MAVDPDPSLHRLLQVLLDLVWLCCRDEEGGGEGRGIYRLSQCAVDVLCYLLNQAPLLPDIGVCKGGKGHLLHKREVVLMDEEAVELDRKVEDKRDNVEGETSGECSNLLWLGEPMPAPPKARTITLFLFQGPPSV